MALYRKLFKIFYLLMNDLFIISNENISKDKYNFSSANVDFKTIIEGLKYSFNIVLIARQSNKKENFIIQFFKF